MYVIRSIAQYCVRLPSCLEAVHHGGIVKKGTSTDSFVITFSFMLTFLEEIGNAKGMRGFHSGQSPMPARFPNTKRRGWHKDIAVELACSDKAHACLRSPNSPRAAAYIGPAFCC